MPFDISPESKGNSDEITRGVKGRETAEGEGAEPLSEHNGRRKAVRRQVRIVLPSAYHLDVHYGLARAGAPCIDSVCSDHSIIIQISHPSAEPQSATMLNQFKWLTRLRSRLPAYMHACMHAYMQPGRTTSSKNSLASYDRLCEACSLHISFALLASFIDP